MTKYLDFFFMWKSPQLGPLGLRPPWPQQTSTPKPLYALVWNSRSLGPWGPKRLQGRWPIPHKKKSSINVRNIKISRVGIFRLVNSLFWSLSLGLVRGSTLNFYTFALSGVRGGRRARVSGRVGYCNPLNGPPLPPHTKKYDKCNIQFPIWI